MRFLERREWLVAVAIGVFVHPLGALIGPLLNLKQQPLAFSLPLWGLAALVITLPLLLLAVIASLFRGERRRYAPTRHAFWLLAIAELVFQLWGQTHAYALLPEGAAGTRGMFALNAMLAHLAASVLALFAFFVLSYVQHRRSRAALNLAARSPAPKGDGPRPA